MAEDAAPPSGIGVPVLRKEDRRFLTGQGRYVGDIHAAGELQAVFLRAPHGHAAIRRIDVDAARRLPGVVHVATGGELRAAGVGDIPCSRRPPNKDRKSVV